MNSKAASSSSQLKTAVPPKRAKVEEEVQTNETMQDLNEAKKELERVTKTLLSIEEDRDMWKILFKDCNVKQGEEIERLGENLRSSVKNDTRKGCSSWAVPDGASNASRTKPNIRGENSAAARVTIPNPGDTVADPVVEQTLQRLIETAGRLVANKGFQVPGFHPMDRSTIQAEWSSPWKR